MRIFNLSFKEMKQHMTTPPFPEFSSQLGGGMMVGDIRCIFQFLTLPLSKLFLLPKSDREGSKILIWFQLEGSTIQQNISLKKN